MALELASPWRRSFDASRTPYEARIALGIVASGPFQPLDGDLTALAALTGTNTIYYRSAADTWSPVVIGSNLTFSGGTLSAAAGGNVSNSGTPAANELAQWVDATHIKGVAIATAMAAYAPLASPAFTGNPTAPTASPGDNDTSIATTAFVTAAITAGGGSYAPIASPTFTGDPKAPTPTAGDNDTSIATTAFVTNAVAAVPPSGKILLSSVAPAGGVTSVIFDSTIITSTYDAYELEVCLFNNSGSNAAVVLLFSTNNGSSYASSYVRASTYSTQASTGGDLGSASAASIVLAPTGQASLASPLTATAKIYRPTVNGIWKNVHLQGAGYDGSNWLSWVGTATYNASTSPITNFKIQLDNAGAFGAGGFVKLYGLK